MAKTKLNGWLKVIAIAAMLLVAALGAVYGYGRVTERVDGNDTRVTAIEKNLEPRVRAIEQSMERVETKVDILLERGAEK